MRGKVNLSFAEIVDNFRVAGIPLAAHSNHVFRFVKEAYLDKRLIAKASFLLDYHNWHIRSRGNMDNLMVQLQSPANYHADK